MEQYLYVNWRIDSNRYRFDFFAITIAILNYFDYVVKFTQHQQTQIKKYF